MNQVQQVYSQQGVDITKRTLKSRLLCGEELDKKEFENNKVPKESEEVCSRELEEELVFDFEDELETAVEEEALASLIFKKSPNCQFLKIDSWGFFYQILPKSNKITRIRRISPRPPLGPYPQLALCGHDGNAPTSNKIKRIIRIVLNIIVSFL